MKLIVLGLPIGNIKDITLRGIETLNTASCIVCEDSRVIGKLWQKLKKEGFVDSSLPKLVVLNDFNEKTSYSHVYDQLLEHSEVVLVSDAGMPTLSDPGYKLITTAIKKGDTVTCAPGVSAITTALAVSGLPTDRFCFLGFPPKKPKKREEFIKQVADISKQMTVVLFEGPYKIESLLKSLKEHQPKTDVTICRELTKTFEEIIRINLENELPKLRLQGEFTIVVSSK